jgi:hypothetical protein
MQPKLPIRLEWVALVAVVVLELVSAWVGWL